MFRIALALLDLFKDKLMGMSSDDIAFFLKNLNV